VELGREVAAGREVEGRSTGGRGSTGRTATRAAASGASTMLCTEPVLKPSQPNHSTKSPSTCNTEEWPGIGTGLPVTGLKRPTRGPISAAPTSDTMPPAPTRKATGTDSCRPCYLRRNVGGRMGGAPVRCTTAPPAKSIAPPRTASGLRVLRKPASLHTQCATTG
jgi:hypothetical protein